MKVTYRIEFSENKIIGNVPPETALAYIDLEAILKTGAPFAPDNGSYNKTYIEMFVDGEKLTAFRLDMQADGTDCDLRQHLIGRLSMLQTSPDAKEWAEHYYARPAMEVTGLFAKFLNLTFVG